MTRYVITARLGGQRWTTRASDYLTAHAAYNALCVRLKAGDDAVLVDEITGIMTICSVMEVRRGN